MTKSIQAQAASEIRAKLKAAGFNAKVRSRSASMMTAVDIKVTNETPQRMDELNTIVAPYQYGSFNGMEDIYEYTNSRNDIPQVKYVQVSNNITEELRAKVYQWLRGYFVGGEELPETYAEGRNERFHGEYMSQMVWRYLSQERLFNTMTLPT